MATAESAPASSGPRYAPEDPTLPKPWKGLIDGSTGVLYYWNPDTNVTQYERPAALAPPLPTGPPPTPSIPKLAPIPMARTLQPNGIIGQQGLQMPQQLGQQLPQQQGMPIPQQQGQQIPQQQQQGQQMPQQQQQGQQMPHQQQGNQMAHQQQGHQWPHLQQGQQLPQQQQGQQLPQTQGQQLPNQPLGQQIQQQMPQQQVQQMPHHLGQQFSFQQLQQIPYPGQQISHMQSQQISEQQAHQNVLQQGQQIQHKQGQQFGYPQREETGFQQGKQTGFSSPQVQQTGFSSIHNLPAENHPIQASQVSFHAVHTQQTASSSISAQQAGGSLIQAQQTGMDSIHQKQIGGPMVQSQTGPSMLRNQQAGGPPLGLKTGYEEGQPGRAGNDFYFSGNREQGMMIPQQPKLAPIPLPHNQQEMRMGTAHPQTVTPGHMGGPNIVGGRPMTNVYNHSAGGQTFPNNAPARPSPRILGPSDLTNVSAAEVYRQEHEVSASGDNVPAPFMTFEATGFPPEILREVRYLLQRGAYVVRCAAIHPDYTATALSLGAAKIYSWSLSCGQV
eukprot:TRINITY_DN2310_c0_g1_i4.p2 TRINITY_DN2310_c0_g1~~TRINITY_DN2310_c0_g1_i4.p2  ORF type:complete len:558 (+),score=142.32 TRINITY_DN2310_c0_g1_i4:331-2004(+)